ncbi:uncharacterized protein LOC132366768 [Balaenoptera ricei]|uniref:uncharacterized protein LOC132366768 n=1 Tax=Balaenoptera ricei TaxID=2746895 RepID=UPI0028BE8803|nr:uncharacterized protein LOC132366768 [Balaenoptera ricei]
MPCFGPKRGRGCREERRGGSNFDFPASRKEETRRAPARARPPSHRHHAPELPLRLRLSTFLLNRSEVGLGGRGPEAGHGLGGRVDERRKPLDSEKHREPEGDHGRKGPASKSTNSREMQWGTGSTWGGPSPGSTAPECLRWWEGEEMEFPGLSQKVAKLIQEIRVWGPKNSVLTEMSRGRNTVFYYAGENDGEPSTRMVGNIPTYLEGTHNIQEVQEEKP